MKTPSILLAAALAGACSAGAPDAPALLAAKAPATPDGDVVGRPAELFIDLGTWPDPASPGRTPKAGRGLRITLPPAFVDTGTAPVADDAGAPRCGPAARTCNTVALLQGRPQNPLPSGRYAVAGTRWW